MSPSLPLPLTEPNSLCSLAEVGKVLTTPEHPLPLGQPGAELSERGGRMGGEESRGAAEHGGSTKRGCSFLLLTGIHEDKEQKVWRDKEKVRLKGWGKRNQCGYFLCAFLNLVLKQA